MNIHPNIPRRGPGVSLLMTFLHVLGAVLLGLLGFAGASAILDGSW